MEKSKMDIHSNSKTYAEFASIRDGMCGNIKKDVQVFTEKDVSRLPYPVKKYLFSCGYMGAPKMNVMKVVYPDVRFLLGKRKPITINYLQYNTANRPARIAYIGSSMYGIPFEGLDSYVDGDGSMKGVLAKFFTLFNQTGEAINRACLVTFLSECLMIPNAALQGYISWEGMDDLHAAATISHYDNSASGIFTFNQAGQMLSFETNDREAIVTNGTSKKVRWTAVFGEYRETQGIKKPTLLQAIWHYGDGDLLYFDAKDVSIEYDPKLF